MDTEEWKMISCTLCGTIYHMKICSKCKEKKPINEYRKDKTKIDGLYSSCNDCYRKRTGQVKMPHRVLGIYDGFEIIKGYPYPYIYKSIPRKRIHIYVMEKKIGRKLLTNEHVHHINGNKEDWREENLAILTESEHHKYESTLMWRTSRKSLYDSGIFVKCSMCRIEKRKPNSYVQSRWHGDKQLMKRFYTCENCHKGRHDHGKA